MPLTVFTQRNFIADFLQAKGNLDENRPFCLFGIAFLGGLGATYDNHLRLIGKRVMDILLVLIALFSLSVTAEALRANIGSPTGAS